MNKNTTISDENPWADSTEETAAPKETKSSKAKKIADEVLNIPAPAVPVGTSTGEYDIDGLMTDFPTATQLERFVFDETGIVLNLKGRANKLKYQVAMDALNGVPIDLKYTGNSNPYIDKADMVPIDPIRPIPQRDPSLPPTSELQNSFWSPNIPHPDATARAQDKKCHMTFRKYKNGMISYEVNGPISPRPHGNKIDKYGRNRPEVIQMVDPRTGEQVAVREDGSLTQQGKRLRAMMQTFRVNKSNFWETWVDREFVSLNDSVAHNPWDLK